MTKNWPNSQQHHKLSKPVRCYAPWLRAVSYGLKKNTKTEHLPKSVVKSLFKICYIASLFQNEMLLQAQTDEKEESETHTLQFGV